MIKLNVDKDLSQKLLDSGWTNWEIGMETTDYRIVSNIDNGSPETLVLFEEQQDYWYPIKDFKPNLEHLPTIALLTLEAIKEGINIDYNPNNKQWHASFKHPKTKEWIEFSSDSPIVAVEALIHIRN